MSLVICEAISHLFGTRRRALDDVTYAASASGRLWTAPYIRVESYVEGVRVVA